MRKTGLPFKFSCPPAYVVGLHVCVCVCARAWVCVQNQAMVMLYSFCFTHRMKEKKKSGISLHIHTIYRRERTNYHFSLVTSDVPYHGCGESAAKRQLRLWLYSCKVALHFCSAPIQWLRCVFHSLSRMYRSPLISFIPCLVLYRRKKLYLV